MENVSIPTLYPVKQALPKGDPVDIDRTLDAEWGRLGLAAQVRGKRIALGFGSRGVASIDRIAGKLVALVKASGGKPFIVPAMGSHGGGTPEGQIEVLDGLGIQRGHYGLSDPRHHGMSSTLALPALACPPTSTRMSPKPTA